ncbi:MAG: 30S ribosomal protein S20 [Deltaproteobacteria bacterium]|nr:30S ribosomal protein S20 [Candidatus Anaeroferrophillus wilburensis]MBN2888431.1 30S ribosomal protein S20 [Deltaproteobacteria bacterium]
MANHPSALKRMRQNEKRRLRNRQVVSRMRTSIKKLRLAAEEGQNPAALAEMLQQVKVVIDKAATKGVLHRNNASRKISRLSKMCSRVASV